MFMETRWWSFSFLWTEEDAAPSHQLDCASNIWAPFLPAALLEGTRGIFFEATEPFPSREYKLADTV